MAEADNTEGTGFDFDMALLSIWIKRLMPLKTGTACQCGV